MLIWCPILIVNFEKVFSHRIHNSVIRLCKDFLNFYHRFLLDILDNLNWLVYQHLKKTKNVNSVLVQPGQSMPKLIQNHFTYCQTVFRGLALIKVEQNEGLNIFKLSVLYSFSVIERETCTRTHRTHCFLQQCFGVILFLHFFFHCFLNLRV